MECWLANPGIVMSGTGNTLRWAGHHRDVSFHGDIPARRRPAGMIQLRLLTPPTAGRAPEQVEAAHSCKEWLCCLGVMAGRGWNLMEVVYYCKATRDDGCNPVLAGDDRRFWRRLPLNSPESSPQSMHDDTPIGFGARRRKCMSSSGSFAKQTARSCP